MRAVPHRLTIGSTPAAHRRPAPVVLSGAAAVPESGGTTPTSTVRRVLEDALRRSFGGRTGDL